MTFQEIQAVQISEAAYRETVSNILETLVHGAMSPFNDMMQKYEDYLDKATDLDVTQRQAAYADMLKSTYSEVSKQAMQYAMDLHKSNSELVIARFNAEASYNKALAEIALAEEQKALVASQAVGSERENQLRIERIAESKLTQAKVLAELKTQWGQDVTLGSSTTTTVTNPDGSVTATTSYGGTTIEDSGKDSVVQKQIRGYDVVNYKDVLKTLDERAALMQNAKVQEQPWEVHLRAELLHKILVGEGTATNDSIKYVVGGSGNILTNGTLGDWPS
jgi:hypothetical protein